MRLHWRPLVTGLPCCARTVAIWRRRIFFFEPTRGSKPLPPPTLLLLLPLTITRALEVVGVTHGRSSYVKRPGHWGIYTFTRWTTSLTHSNSYCYCCCFTVPTTRIWPQGHWLCFLLSKHFYFRYYYVTVLLTITYQKLKIFHHNRVLLNGIHTYIHT